MFKIIKQGTVGIKETLGKFTRSLDPGIHFYIPLVQSVFPINTQINEIKMDIDARTADKTFSLIKVAVHYQVDNNQIERAVYTQRKAVDQLASFAEKEVRAVVSKMSLQDLFEDQSRVSQVTKEGLASILFDRGYLLRDVLIIDIKPDRTVQTAMNEVQASRRRAEAATNEADAYYIKTVREAEAEKTKRILHGEGIAGQREAIQKGLRESIHETISSTGLSSDVAAQLTLETLRLDTYNNIGTTPGNTKVIFLPGASLDKSMVSALESR